MHCKTEALGYYYCGWGSPSYNFTPQAGEGPGGAPGYASTTGDGKPGQSGTVGSNRATGGVGTAGSNSSPALPSGRSSSCFGGCTFVAHVPTLLPVFGVFAGGHITLPLRCTVRCHGTGTLMLLNAAGASRTSAHFKFHLAAHKLASLRIRLSAAARKLVAHQQATTVELTAPTQHSVRA